MNANATELKVKNPKYKELAAEVFKQAAFIENLGLELADCGPGWAETELALKPFHLQQNGVVHAGVYATMADHTAGGAASTLVAENEYVLTLEFKINLLRAAAGEGLRCRAQTIKPGSRFSVVEAEVFVRKGGQDILAAKATATMAIMQR